MNPMIDKQLAAAFDGAEVAWRLKPSITRPETLADIRQDIVPGKKNNLVGYDDATVWRTQNEESVTLLCDVARHGRITFIVYPDGMVALEIRTRYRGPLMISITWDLNAGTGLVMDDLNKYEPGKYGILLYKAMDAISASSTLCEIFLQTCETLRTELAKTLLFHLCAAQKRWIAQLIESGEWANRPQADS